VISLERLDELQFGAGDAVTRDELLELVLSHRLVQRLDRTLEGQVRRLESLRRDIRIELGRAPEPAALVAVVNDAEGAGA
jgi:hypothetical protein